MSVGPIKTEHQIIHGRVFLIVTGQNGEVKAVRETSNMYIQGGRDIMASAVALSQGRRGAQWIGIATGPSVASDDTTLTAETQSRVQACFSHAAGSINWTEKATWVGLSASKSLNEAGIFDSATGGGLFAKASFAELAVASQDTLTIKWTFSISIG